MKKIHDIRNAVKMFFVIIFSFALIGCGQDKTIKMPFSHEDLELKQYSEVEKELKELGFTNISYDTSGIRKDVSSDYSVGAVVGVYFDGEWEFKKGDKFETDVPITITYLVENEIPVPISSEKCKNLSCEEVIQKFQKAGFEEIDAYTTDGEEMDNYAEKMVSYVTIGFSGSSHYYDSFSKGDKFNADDWVTVYCTDSTEEITQAETNPDEVKNNAKSIDKETMVWVTETGEKYHSKQSCGRSKGAVQISLSEAEKRGLEPCQLCH